MLFSCLTLARATGAYGQELDFLVSPGPLSDPHGHLAGLGNCDACHSPGKGVEDTKCLGCHKDLAERIGRGSGFHKDKQTDCFGCHAEHQGEGASLVTFTPASFDHRETGYPLLGRHLSVEDCAGCHKAPNSLPRETTRTYLLGDSRCIACHADEHRGQLGEDCSRCHPLDHGFNDVRFDHQRTAFPLRGPHARLGCVRCHGNGQWTGLKFSRCSDCHQDPHRPSLGPDCERCHRAAAWTVVQFDHDRTRYPLSGRHRAVECVQCHPMNTFKKISFAGCMDCHRRDPHAGQFREDCSRCHTVQGFDNVLFRHQTSSYPLTGRHVDVACNECHSTQKGEFPAGMATAVRYKPLPTECGDCHQDIHLGQFEKNCSACHTVDGFHIDTLQFQHNEDSRYPLEGKHMSVACGQCHHLQETGSLSANQSRAVRYRPLSDRCIDCHPNVHAPSRSSTEEQSGADCRRCHDTHSFKVVGFDHRRTSLPLDGKHASVACERCHASFQAGDRTVLSFQQIPNGCAGCHPSPHSKRQSACLQCHTTTTWRVLAW